MVIPICISRIERYAQNVRINPAWPFARSRITEKLMAPLNFPGKVVWNVVPAVLYAETGRLTGNIPRADLELFTDLDRENDD